MFRLSKKLLFAIEAVVDIAYHAGPGPVRSIDISRRQGIPRRYLGGYCLARERRRITVGEIVRIVRDLEGAGDPVSESNGSEIGLKVVRPLWLEAQQEMLERFDKLTIEQLCNQARKMEIASEAVKVPDFSI